jgi:putative salt-induced outer membrane protein YdiY/small nuclear ribonucleoprotein (snRNP)-like protein
LARSIFLVLALSVFAGTTFGDQVTLKNGDRLTGTIVKFDQEKLVMKAEYAGDVSLQWNAVVSIVSTQALHVTLKNGRTIEGVVTTKDEKFEVTCGSGSVEAAKTEVAAVRNNTEQEVYMRSLHPHFFDVWSGLLDTGLSLTSGNSDSTSFALSAKAARVTKQTKISLNATEIYTRSTLAGVSSTTASAIRGGARVDVNLGRRWFVFGLTDFEHDRFQDLDLRSVLGGGFGYHVIKATDRTLDVFGGATFDQEYYSQPFDPPDPSTTRKSGEVVAGESLSTKLGGRTTLTEQFSIFPNVTDTGHYRLQFDATVATKLKNWLSWQVTFSDRYVSKPLEGLENNDLLFSTGLRLTFGKGVF